MAHRDANGPFKSRKALKKVPRLGPKAFEQCAGFLRILGGDDPLDASGVHPEAYPVVRRILAATKSDIKALIGNSDGRSHAEAERFRRRDVWPADRHRHPARAGKARPRPAPGVQGRDVQGGRRGRSSDLKPGMVLEGTVTNVAAFGAFVDIGVHQDGLVHISAMSKTFVKDPREVVKPGDIVKVKVLDFEVARKRISLTLRLDDEVGAKKDAPGMQRDNSSRNPSRMTSSAPRKQESSGAAAPSPKRCAARRRRTAASGREDLTSPRSSASRVSRSTYGELCPHRHCERSEAIQMLSAVGQSGLLRRECSSQ